MEGGTRKKNSRAELSQGMLELERELSLKRPSYIECTLKLKGTWS